MQSEACVSHSEDSRDTQLCKASGYKFKPYYKGEACAVKYETAEVALGGKLTHKDFFLKDLINHTRPAL